jgi:peptide/nickel transport system substrate-binding protein
MKTHREDDYMKKIRSVHFSRRSFLRMGGTGLGAALLAKSLTGCGPAATPTAPAETPVPGVTPTPAPPVVTEPTGSVTFLSAENLLGRFDPYNNSNLAHDRLQKSVLDYLFFRDDDLKIVPGLATSHEMIDDTTWEFKLRQGVKFHDGQNFTAADVKASLEYASNKDNVSSFTYPNPMEVEVVDDYTCRVHTGVPFAALVNSAMSNGQAAGIACAEDIAKGKEWLDQKLNGTGPFKWVRYGGEGEGVVLEANMDYWGGPFNQKPKFKTYNFKYVGDSSARLAALQTGEAQIIDRVEPDQVAVIEADPNLAVSRVFNTEFKWCTFRVNMPNISKAQVRQAIAYAIDRETIVNDIMLGSGKLADSFLSSAQDCYVPDPNFPKYDPEKAKELLAAAGYPNGEGLPELNYMTSIGFYPKTKEYGEFIVQNLADVGIKAKLSVMEVAVWNQNIYIHDSAEIADQGWFCTPPDPDIVINTLFRTTGMTSGFSDPEVDAVIAREASAMVPEERCEIITGELVPMLIERMPYFPLFQTEMITGHSAKLKGLVMPPSSEWYAERWWLEE